MAEMKGLMQSMSLMHRKRSLFTVQRLMFLGLMALVLSTALTLTTGVASAKTAFAASTSENPALTGCYTNAQTEESNVNAVPGIFGMTATIDLRYSSSCKTEWARIVFNKPMPSGYEGNAIVTRNYDGRQLDCTSGDGVVIAGQTSCYSGMLYGGPDTIYPEYAAGMYHAVGNRWLEFTRTVPA